MNERVYERVSDRTFEKGSERGCGERVCGKRKG